MGMNECSMYYLQLNTRSEQMKQKKRKKNKDKE